MKIISLIFILCLSCLTTYAQREKIAIAGSYASNIIIIDKETKKVEWSLPLPFAANEGGECNSITSMPDGSILFTYKKGARLVKRSGEIVWDFPRPNDNQEIQTAIATKDGFMLALCGNPSKFIFLDKQGKQISETSYECGIQDIHAQFRQVRLLQNGNILLPLMGAPKVIELNKKGEEIRTIPTQGGTFSTEELNAKKFIISGGDGVKIYSRKNGLMEKVLVKDTLPNIRIAFSTQTALTDKGTLLLTNWQGYAPNTQMQIIELDPTTNEILWTFRDTTAIKFVSAIHQFTE